MRVLDLTINDLGANTGMAGEYFLSPTFQKDRQAGKLFCLSGNAAARYPLFSLVAKVFALSDLSTYLTSVNRLGYMLEDDDGGRQKLERVSHLFVDDFEKTFRDGTNGFPFTHRERYIIEDFLKAREEQGKATFYSSSVPWEEMKWWSSDFIQGFVPIMIDVQVER